MVHYITKRCPHCGAVFEHYSKGYENSFKYGSPIKMCNECNGIIIDSSTVEPGTMSFESFISDQKKQFNKDIIKECILGTFLTVMFVASCLSEKEAPIFLILILGGLSILVLINLIVDIVKGSRWSAEEFESYKSSYLNSVNHLASSSYAQMLKKHNIYVPNIYYDTEENKSRYIADLNRRVTNSTFSHHKVKMEPEFILRKAQEQDNSISKENTNNIKSIKKESVYKTETTNMNNRFCRYCGAKIPKDSVFCENCGKQL